MPHVSVQLHDRHHLDSHCLAIVRHSVEAAHGLWDACDALALQGENVHMPPFNLNLVTLGIKHPNGDEGVGDGRSMQDVGQGEQARSGPIGHANSHLTGSLCRELLLIGGV
jgi:hypothetical protein